MRIFLKLEVFFMAGYQTKSRNMVLNFLDRNPDASYTAEALAEALQKECGSAAPGKSTVYRLVNRLVQEERIRRFETDGARSAQYQINGCGCHDHLHLKCTDCGKLIHMQEHDSELLLRKVLKTSGFAVDERQTVLFGRCENCNNILKGTV